MILKADFVTEIEVEFIWIENPEIRGIQPFYIHCIVNKIDKSP